MLDTIICQKIVDQIISHVKCNVNIIDEDGIIIASGDKSRIGTFHQAGSEALTKQCRVDIISRDETVYPGSQAGVNLPFYLHNKVAGVLGITGAPKKIEPIVSIAKAMIELLLEQEYLKERLFLQENKKTFFMNSILNIQDETDEENVITWGEKSGFAMHIARKAFLFHSKNKALMLKSLHAIDKIKSHFPQDIYAKYNLDKIVIFHALNEAPVLDDTRYIDKLLELLGIPQEGMLVGIGSTYCAPRQLKNSLQEATYMLKFAQNAQSKAKTADIAQHALTHIITHLPKEMLQKILQNYLDKLAPYPDYCKTITQLYLQDMSITNAAKKNFVHRNTLLFRLAKIKDHLALDPFQNENDRVLFHLLAEFIILYGPSDIV